MFYLYDWHGWYSGTADRKTKRSTDIAPENLRLSAEPGDMRSNWTGYVWVDMPYVYAEHKPRVEYVEKISNTISPVELKLLFTTRERLAIKDARELDPIIQDAFELLDDTRLKEIDLNSSTVSEILYYLVIKELITESRMNEILGIPFEEPRGE